MLKLFRGLVLTAVLIVANAYVPPAYATSSNVIITHIQAGGSGAALQELVILYNNSTDEVDITGWCLKNKNHNSIGCFNTPTPNQRYYLTGHGFALIGSVEFGPISLDISYSSANRSSGDIVGSSDTISLVDKAGNTIDEHSWTTSLAGGSIWARKLDTPMTYLDTDQTSNWELSRLQSLPLSGVTLRMVTEDLCSNIEGLQTEVPEGLELKGGGYCLPPQSHLLITELLPNASGTDDGKEFIEIYNPNDRDIDLIDYVLKVGPSFENKHGFPMGVIIPAHSYLSFSNAEIHYTLLNTSSRVQLSSGLDGLVFSETPSYQDPDDDTAWAFIAGEWQYTNRPTPSAQNLASDTVPTEENNEVNSLQACAANQYRSPETGRCRLIAVAVSPTPCKDGQYRSEETNRCRNIATDANVLKACDEGEERNLETGRCRKIVVAAEPVPCKEGQERNPETNRCRNIVAVTKADYAVLGTQTASGSNNWYIWAAIAGILLAAIGYGVWEWRYELSKLWGKVLKFVRIRK